MKASIVAVAVAATLLPWIGAGVASATTTEPITPNGPPVTVTVTTPGSGNEFDLTFAGAPGQQVSVSTSAGTFNNCDVQMSLVDPDGQTVAGPICGGVNDLLDSTRLDDLGQYFIRVLPSPTATGSVQVRLHSFSDRTAAMTAGTAVNVNIVTPGQNFVGSYAGTAGGRVSVSIANPTFPNCDGTNLTILNPDGSTLATTGLCNTALLDAAALAYTGSYRVVLNPAGADTGTVTLTANNVSDQTAAMTAGTAVNVNIVTPGQNFVGSYAGTAGGRVSVSIANPTFPNCDGTNLTILNPDGSTLATTGLCNTALLDAAALAYTGSYRVVLNPAGADTGTVTLTANNVSDQTAAMTAGTAVNVNIVTPGQNFVGSYAGTAGGRVSVSIANPTFPNCDGTNLTILNPDGSTLATTGLCNTALLDAAALAYTGSYRVVLNPAGADTGTVTLTANNVSDQTAAMTAGTAVNVNIVTPGQNFVGSYAGTAGGRVSVSIANPTFPNCDGTNLTILNPDGSTLATTGVCNGAGIGPVNLPSTGTYRVVLNPAGADTGTAGVTVALDDLSSITVTPVAVRDNGTASTVQVTLLDPARHPRVGHTVTLTAANGSSLITPGSGVSNSNGQVNFQVTDTTAETVTYLATDTTASVAVGNAAVIFASAAPQTAAMVSGSGVSVNLASPGQVFAGTFSGTAGAIVSVNLTNSTMAACYTLSLVGPDGLGLASPRACGTQDDFAGPISLPVTGTYTVTLVPDGASTGTATVTYFKVVNQTAAMVSGTGVPVSLTSPGQVFAGTFSGTAGNIASVNMTNSNMTACYTLRLVGPDGVALASPRACGTQDDFAGPVHLPLTGTYTVTLVPDGASTGTATVTYFKVVNQTAAMVSGTGVPVSLTSPGQMFAGTFSGTVGNIASVNMTNSNMTACYTLRLVGPDGLAVTSSRACGTQDDFAGPIHLPVTGTYTVTLVPDGNSTGTATITYFKLVNQTAAMVSGTGVPVSLTSPGQVFAGTFSGTAGAIVSVNLTNSTMAACYTLSLVGPDGVALTSPRACGSQGDFAGPVHLPLTGTYTVTLVPDFSSTGTATITYFNVANQTTAVKLNGPAVPVNLTTPGQQYVSTFAATAGNEVSVTLSTVNMTGCYTVALVGPAGTTVASAGGCGTTAASLSFVGLAQTGSTAIELIPVGAATGSASLQLTGLQVDAPPTAELNVHYSTTLKADPGTAPYTWAITAGSLPAGLSFDAATGKISGKPTATGTSAFTVMVTDAQFQTASKATSITVVQPLLITTTSLPNGSVGSSYNAPLSATGGTTPYTWSIVVGTLPPGLGIDSATGVISGTPTASGTSAFTVEVKDSSQPALSEKANLSITVS